MEDKKTQLGGQNNPKEIDGISAEIVQKTCKFSPLQIEQLLGSTKLNISIISHTHITQQSSSKKKEQIYAPQDHQKLMPISTVKIISIK